MSSSDKVSLYPHTGTAFALKPTSSFITGEYLFNKDNFEEIRVMYGDMSNISLGSGSTSSLAFDSKYPRLVNFTFNLKSNTANAHITKLEYRTKTYGNDSFDFYSSTLYYHFEDDYFPHGQISISLLCLSIVSFTVENRSGSTNGLGVDWINVVVMN